MWQRQPTVLLAGALAAGAALADSCNELAARINEKIRAAGVSSFSLTILDAAAETREQVVGTCAQGSRKIVYAKAAGNASPAQPAASGSLARPVSASRREPILTECKDGSSSVGGDCKP